MLVAGLSERVANLAGRFRTTTALARQLRASNRPPRRPIGSVQFKEDHFMKYPNHAVLQFVGGPYDGFSQEVDDLEGELVETVEMPVNQNLIRVMTGQSPGPRHTSRAAAVYRVAQNSHGVRYAFFKMRPLEGQELLNMNAWCSEIVKNWLRAKNGN